MPVLSPVHYYHKLVPQHAVLNKSHVTSLETVRLAYPYHQDYANWYVDS
jgi:hypothetical protein